MRAGRGRDTADAYLVARSLLLTEALRCLRDLDLDARADAADLLDLLAEVLTEAGADAPDAS